MIYVFDSSPLIDLFKHYYPDCFPSLWENFDALILEQRIISVREVRNELERWNDRLSDWVKNHRELFLTPTYDELNFVTEIFKETHFQSLVRQKTITQGKPVADPFVIAKAQALEEGCVVTQEIYKPGSAQIPNVCEHFDTPCMNLEAFMKNEKWRF